MMSHNVDMNELLALENIITNTQNAEFLGCNTLITFSQQARIDFEDIMT